MDKILYFPYISIPKSSWLIQTLLYWDEIASIVPFEFTNKPEELPLHTQALLSDGLLTQIFPEQYTYNIDGFVENFIQYIDNDIYINKIIHSINFLNGNNYTEFVHAAKLDVIGDYLVERKLAKKHSWHWYRVEPYTAQAFMSYLAVVIGNETGFVPSTDRKSGLSLITIPNQANYPEPDYNLKDIIRQRIFDSIMPVPEDIYELYSILKFKNKYHNELCGYRNYIEYFIMDIDISPEYQIEERLSRFIYESKEQMSLITSHMKPLGRINFVTLCSIAATIVPGVTALSGNNPDPSKFYNAIPGLLGTIYTVLKKNKKTMKQPLAYAAIVNKNYI